MKKQQRKKGEFKRGLLKVCYGITSKATVSEHYEGHIPFFDYDNKRLLDVRNHLLDIQKRYDLSDIYIIKSENGYNALSLDIMPLSIINQMGTEIQSICDRDFFKYGFKRGYFVLRFDCDKLLIEILKSPFAVYTKSLAHKKFLEMFFRFTIKQNGFNTNTKLDLIQYPSNKNGYHMVEKELPEYLGRFLK